MPDDFGFEPSFPDANPNLVTFYFPQTPEATKAAGLKPGIEGGTQGGPGFGDIDLRQHTLEQYQAGNSPWVAVAQKGRPTGDLFHINLHGQQVLAKNVDTGGGLRPGQIDVATENPQLAKAGIIRTATPVDLVETQIEKAKPIKTEELQVARVIPVEGGETHPGMFGFEPLQPATKVDVSVGNLEDASGTQAPAQAAAQPETGIHLATDSEYAKRLFPELESPESQQALKNFTAEAVDAAKGLPAFVLKQMPKYAWKGLQIASGNKPLPQAAHEILSEAVPMGQQMASDLQQPPGSREWFRGLIQTGMMAAPALDLIPGIKGAEVTPGVKTAEAPPVQEAPAEVPASAPETPEAAAGATVAETPETQPAAVAESATVAPVEQMDFGFEPVGANVTSEFAAGLREEPTSGALPADVAGPDVPDTSQPSRVAEPAGTLFGEPVRTESGAQTGISQARTEAELGPGSVEPGIGAEIGSGLDFGRNYINQGGDPRLPIRRALASGLVGRNEIGIVHAELERLRSERAIAGGRLADNPTDPQLQDAYHVADSAQRSWRKELQPVLTKAGDALREAYAGSQAAPDLGTYQGLADLFDQHYGGARDVTPEMRTAMTKAARGVREARQIANDAITEREKVLTRASKSKYKMTTEQLDADLRSVIEKEFKDCIFV